MNIAPPAFKKLEVLEELEEIEETAELLQEVGVSEEEETDELPALWQSLLDKPYNQLYVERYHFSNNQEVQEILADEHFWRLKYLKDFDGDPPSNRIEEAYVTKLLDSTIEAKVDKILAVMRYDIDKRINVINEKYQRFLDNSNRQPVWCKGESQEDPTLDVSDEDSSNSWILKPINDDNGERNKLRSEDINSSFKHYIRKTASARDDSEYYGIALVSFYYQNYIYFAVETTKYDINDDLILRPNDLPKLIYEYIKNNIESVIFMRLYIIMPYKPEENFLWIVAHGENNSVQKVFSLNLATTRRYLKQIVTVNSTFPIVSQNSVSGCGKKLCGPWYKMIDYFHGSTS